MANLKTNAMRILEKAGILYETYTYNNRDGLVDGVSVAAKLGQPVEKVYKTLVTQAVSKEYYVFIIPVVAELDLKAAARAVGEKAVEMIKVTDINKVTGYIRGGCSPIGMKKPYKTVLDGSCEVLDTIIVSAGKIGYQIEIAPKDLITLLQCSIDSITIHQNK
ncbi:Cys-tRNA(Pro) deacylase [Clostridium aceticum]|uniref:Cys-tRNA(Pro)/Cys-tRNA(Cys) deacylase n=1 Tax=Clostridium aceticum TaxID=84022 RepID=A0A0D8ID36_9CLOT|nr:Cys-tRNA(Pro) deacylase [Clostridium aceticum]AKL95937.1 Cys-tRNA(Pro) deacylase [Clostridium aceticum]KJF27111.1 cysteinyl-tRNA(Pro) deacylase [Clostridium aceticum]